MKNVKIIILLLAVCHLFAACQSENANQAEDKNNKSPTGNFEESAEPTASYYDVLGKRDFSGDTFTILDAVHSPDVHINVALEITGEPINDALFKRDKFIEDTYNLNINYVQIVGNGPGCSSLEKSVKAGMREYDLIVSYVLGSGLSTIVPRQVLYNMIDAPYLSLQSPWWSKMLYENMQYNHKLFYSSGDIYLPTFSQGPMNMMYNKNVFKNHGLEDNLYQLVFDGKWTLDVLEKLIKDTDQDLNSDGKMHAKDDFYGITYANLPEYMFGFLAGAGVKTSEVTGDGELAMTLNTPLTIAKIDKLASMLEPISYADIQDPPLVTFQEGRAMFLATCMIVPTWLRGMADDFGILPQPKWDENQKSYVSYLNGWGNGYVGIPANADIDKSAFVMEAMAYAGYEMLREPVYEITLSAKVSRDEESARIIDIIIETAFADLGSVYNFGGTQDIIVQAILNNKDFVSAYEKNEPKIQKDIEKFIASWTSD